MTELRLLSSLAKVFPDEAPDLYRPLHAMSGLKNEILSFQAAYRSEDPTYGGRYIRAEVRGIPAGAVRVRRVECVPVQLPCYPDADDNYLRRGPGLFPDALTDAQDTRFRAPFFQWQSLWMDVDASLVPAGRYTVTVCLVYEDTGKTAARASFRLRVLSAELPPQTLIHTKWFHCDSLAEYYGVPVFSEQHWQIIERFAALAVKRGINMLLTPVHTPPLDTEVGHERLTVQLVDIEKTDSGWKFGFDKLRRWVEMADRTGVKYFEIAHFFTQWGAAAAPKITARAGNEIRTVFGWDTPALGEEYQNFLKCYIPALLDELERLNVLDRCWFHISDEPSAKHLEHYLKLRDAVKPLLRGRPIMDALSNYDFFKTGAVDVPIPSSNHIEPFLENRVPGLWTYYCCSQNKKVSNVFLAMPGARTRVFGLQLYKFGIAGILQWGYDYYYARHSCRLIDPWQVTDGDATWPAGDPFQVYPGRGGKPVESMRFMLVAQALQDLRALQLLERLAGRDFTLDLLERGLDEPITFSEYPHSEEWLLNLRERVNREIAARIRHGGKNA